MNERDQLREVFLAHEYLAPEPAVVYAGAKARARSYRRRRRAAQTAGGAVLGAGMVAASVNASSLLPHMRHQVGLTVSAAGAPSANPSPVSPQLALSSPPPTQRPVTSPSPLSSQQAETDLAAYFGAGYDYDEAMQFAKLWNMSGDPAAIKAEAGRRLLAGETLPLPPRSYAVGSADPVVGAREAADVNAFFAAGYTYDDAVALAKLWSVSDPYQAKVEAGAKLLAGDTLAIAAGSAPSVPVSSSDAAASAEQTAVDAFFAAGYTYDDAVTLSKLWKTTDTYQVKIDAGNKLIAHQTLPIKP